MTGAPPLWILVVTGLFFPIMTGLTLAGVVGIFRMASAFTAFRTSVELRFSHNDEQHVRIQSDIEQVHRDLNAHANEEMEIFNERIESLRSDTRALFGGGKQS